jgi:hypothetical protein
MREYAYKAILWPPERKANYYAYPAQQLHSTSLVVTIVTWFECARSKPPERFIALFEEHDNQI